MPPHLQDLYASIPPRPQARSTPLDFQMSMLLRLHVATPTLAPMPPDLQPVSMCGLKFYFQDRCRNTLSQFRWTILQ